MVAKLNGAHRRLKVLTVLRRNDRRVGEFGAVQEVAPIRHTHIVGKSVLLLHREATSLVGLCHTDQLEAVIVKILCHIGIGLATDTCANENCSQLFHSRSFNLFFHSFIFYFLD